jgi:phage host-nuclease inhibitor protein Gam
MSAPLVAVVDRETLGQALRQLRDAQSRIAEINATADAELRRVRGWQESEIANDWELSLRLTALITPYALAEAERQTAMGGHKRVSVPDGDVEVRDQPATAKIVDEAALATWCYAMDADNLIRRKPAPPPEVAWDAVKKLALAGEDVPGVKVEPQPPKVTVKVRSDQPGSRDREEPTDG